MDDLHPDSDDAKTATTSSDNAADADTPSNESSGPAHAAASAEGGTSDEQPAQPEQSASPPADAAGEQDIQPEGGANAHNGIPASAESESAESESAESESAEDELEPHTIQAANGTQRAETPDEPAARGMAAYSKIRELGRDHWGRILLAWRSDSQPGDDQDDQEPPIVLLEREALDIEAARRIIELHLYHARLLAPRAAVEREGGVYWLVVEAPASYEAPFLSVADGGKLDYRSTLKAGVGLANALAYLHTNGVAHGNVAPDVVLVHDGRAYLSGVERAILVETSDPASVAQFTAEVNTLARALVRLAGLPDAPADDEEAPAQAIRAIAARADAGGFVTAEELSQECGQALQEPALNLPMAEESAGRALVFNCGTATTVGLLRSQNQDALGCAVLNIRDDVGRDMPLGIFLVADGMGGEAAGEVASRIGARIAMAELVRQLLVPTVAMPALDPLSPEHINGATSVATLAQALAIAVDAANRQVRGLAAALQESTGTTLTAVVAAGGRAVLAHLGDSRAYLLRDGELVQLTKDHSLLARLLELDHPLLNDPSFGMPRNYLYRSLGQEDEAPPDMMEFPVVPSDRLLICSDGLWDELDDPTILRCLTSTDDPAECANHLVRLANAAGGHDNSTAVVVFVASQHDDPASEISPDEVEAILRSSGALDGADDSESDDDVGALDQTDEVDQMDDVSVSNDVSK